MALEGVVGEVVCGGGLVVLKSFSREFFVVVRGVSVGRLDGGGGMGGGATMEISSSKLAMVGGRFSNAIHVG